MVHLLLSLVVVFVGTVFNTSAAVAQSPGSIEVSVTGAGINVSDLARSEKFYTEVFGLQRVFRYPPEGELLEVGLASPGQPGMSIILAHFNDDPLPEGLSAYGRLIITTNDAAALAKRASERNSTLRNMPPGKFTAPVCGRRRPKHEQDILPFSIPADSKRS